MVGGPGFGHKANPRPVCEAVHCHVSAHNKWSLQVVVGAPKSLQETELQGGGSGAKRTEEQRWGARTDKGGQGWSKEPQLPANRQSHPWKQEELVSPKSDHFRETDISPTGG